jgi:predicted GIY-YIG superfamily endonuclease
MNMTQSNVMAENAILTSPPATKRTAAPNQSAVNSDLVCRMGMLEQFRNMRDQPPQLLDWVDEVKKTRAEKRLDASLKRMEIEQKARLLAETQQRMAEARRTFESRGVAGDEEMAGFASTIEDMFQAMKTREDLMAMEQQRKKELLEDVQRNLRDQWPPTEEMSELPRFLPASRETLDRVFETGPTARTP